MALTVVDAGVLIGFLDRNDSHHQRCVEALEAIVERSDRMVVPASALAEVLVGPSRRGDDAVSSVLQLIERLPVEVAPLDEAVAIVAAAVRAKHRSIKLPDDIVLATASVLGAAALVTTDRGWPTARRLALGIPIRVI